MRRRDFMKGLGALGVTLGSGTRVISKEIDRHGDAVIQEGADTGLYGQEIASESINGGPQTIEESVADDVNPIRALTEHDWSRVLDDMLEKDLQVTHVDGRAQYVNIPKPAKQTLRKKQEWEEMTVDPMVEWEQHDLEHMYVSFMIRDEYMSMDPRQVAELFFYPALQSFAGFINQEAGDHIAVADIELPDFMRALGIAGGVSRGGRIPIRTTVQYDTRYQGCRVSMEFRAKVIQT